MRGFTSGLGDEVCAVCLVEIVAGVDLIASRKRFEWRFIGVGGSYGETVAVGEDYAHAECALEASNSGWEIRT
jgi:hypothetical protein